MTSTMALNAAIYIFYKRQPTLIYTSTEEQLLFVGCLTSYQHASVSQGRICSDNFTCCHTEIEVADQTFHLTQSQYTDTGTTSPSTDPITPGAWQGTTGVPILSHWYDLTSEKSRRKRESSPGSSALEADALTTRPTRRSRGEQNHGKTTYNSIDRDTPEPLGRKGHPRYLFILTWLNHFSFLQKRNGTLTETLNLKERGAEKESGRRFTLCVQPDQHWHCFEGSQGETADRQDGVFHGITVPS